MARGDTGRGSNLASLPVRAGTRPQVDSGPNQAQADARARPVKVAMGRDIRRVTPGGDEGD